MWIVEGPADVTIVKTPVMVLNRETRLVYSLRPTPRAEDISPIHGNSLPIEILVRRGKEHGTGHIPVLAGPSGGDLFGILFAGDVRLLLVVALACSHLAGENAGGNAVDADLEPVLRHLVGQHAGEVNCGGFAGIVRKMVLRRLDDAADGADVDDGAREVVVVLVSRLEGIIPALETSHAFAYLDRLVPTLKPGARIVINLSGRGDKDVNQAAAMLPPDIMSQ